MARLCSSCTAEMLLTGFTETTWKTKVFDYYYIVYFCSRLYNYYEKWPHIVLRGEDGFTVNNGSDVKIVVSGFI